MKKLLKQLFCFHNFKETDQSGNYEATDSKGNKAFTIKLEIFKCDKCGKGKIEIGEKIINIKVKL